MYEVKSLNDCPRRLIITTNNGEVFCSRWFDDDMTEGKNLGRTKKEEEVFSIMCKAHHLSGKDVKEWGVHRNKRADDNAIYITEHAYERIKKRMGLSKKAADRLVLKVYEEGKREYEFDGRQTEYLKRKTVEHRDGVSEYIAYGDFIYVFGSDRTLVTVLFCSPEVKINPKGNGKRPRVTNRYANSQDEYTSVYIKGKRIASKDVKRKFHT